MGGRRTNICLIPPDLTWFVGDYRRMAEGVPRPRRPTGRGGEGSKSLVEEEEEEEEGEEKEEMEEEMEGQADFGPIDNLPMAGGSRSEVCFCLVKIDI